MFSYDPQMPLDLQEHGRETRAGIVVRDISYASPRGGRLRAFLLMPPCNESAAGILFMHPGYTDRRAFLEEALLYSKAGAAALLIDAPYARPPRRPVYSFTERDRQDFIQGVVDLRRGIDLLLRQTGIDAQRLGFIGFSHGAALGALLAGVENRIKAYVLWAGAAHLTYFLRQYARALPPDRLSAYLADMEVLDPIRHICRAAPSALFFQNGRRDKSIPVEEVEALFLAASEPKQIKWYDAGHDLNSPARCDRFEWLGVQLGLAPLSPGQMKVLHQLSSFSMYSSSLPAILGSRLKSFLARNGAGKVNR